MKSKWKAGRYLLLSIFTCFTCEAFGADYPCSHNFLIVGEMVSKTEAGKDASSPSTPFLVAVTADRVLAGWSDIPPVNLQDLTTIGQCRQVFNYSALSLSHSILLECSATIGPDILRPSNRTLTSLVRQRPLREATLQEIVRQAVVGPFNDCPLVFFAQDPTRNLGQAEFCNLANQGEGVLKNEYCEVKLLAADDNGHQSVLVLQKSEDLLCVDPRIKLVDAKSKFYPSGLEEMRVATEFDCRVAELGKVPWTARTVSETIGIDGNSVISNRQVTVKEVLTEPTAVNEAIDRILQLIPEGEPIITDGKHEYRWTNGRIEDASSIAAAEPPKNTPSIPNAGQPASTDSGDASYLPMIAVAGVISISVVIWLLFFKKRTNL